VYGGVVGAIAIWIAWQNELIQLIDIWLIGEFSGIIRGRFDFLWVAGGLAIFAYFLADQFTSSYRSNCCHCWRHSIYRLNRPQYCQSMVWR